MKTSVSKKKPGKRVLSGLFLSGTFLRLRTALQPHAYSLESRIQVKSRRAERRESRNQTKMAIEIEVKCINKTNRTSAHERISHIGGVNADGTRWKLTTDQAIAGIESGKWAFYVNVNYQKVKVIVATSAAGHKYLRTVSDGEQPNNLLSLPECPA